MSNGEWHVCGVCWQLPYLCEPYLPYAWPEKYRLTTEHDIVAIAAIDTTLVIGTKDTLSCPGA